MLEPILNSIPEGLGSQLVGVLLSLLTAGILYLFRSRANLIFGQANNSRNTVFTTNQIDGEDRTVHHEVYVEKFFLQNIGKSTATNVEFVLSGKPTDISIYPPTTVKEQVVEKENWHILIPQIAPGELFIIDCLYINQRAAWISSVKSAETVGKQVQFVTQRKYGRLVTASVLFLMLSGVAFIFSFLITLFS